MCGATSLIVHLPLCHVQKKTVHNELRSDPVFYPMALTGVSKSVFTDYTTFDFELLLGVPFYWY